MWGALDLRDADRVAREILITADLDPDKKHGARKIAERTPGITGIYTAPARDVRLPGRAALFRLGSERYIVVRSNLSKVRARWGALHELGENKMLGITAPNLEEFCNAVAGALAMPRVAFQTAIDLVGPDPHALGKLFDVDPTAAQLRIGEVTGQPLVVLTRSFWWVRGAAWKWPSEAELRKEVRKKHLQPGLRKVRLAPGRVAVAATAILESA